MAIPSGCRCNRVRWDNPIWYLSSKKEVTWATPKTVIVDFVELIQILRSNYTLTLTLPQIKPGCLVLWFLMDLRLWKYFWWSLISRHGRIIERACLSFPPQYPPLISGECRTIYRIKLPFIAPSVWIVKLQPTGWLLSISVMAANPWSLAFSGRSSFVCHIILTPSSHVFIVAFLAVG